MAAGEVAAEERPSRRRRRDAGSPSPSRVIFVLSIAAALAFWEVISRTGVDLARRTCRR